MNFDQVEKNAIKEALSDKIDKTLSLLKSSKKAVNGNFSKEIKNNVKLTITKLESELETLGSLYNQFL